MDPTDDPATGTHAEVLAAHLGVSGTSRWPMAVAADALSAGVGIGEFSEGFEARASVATR